MDYYDYDGIPTTHLHWRRLLNDRAKATVGSTVIGTIHISTQYAGIEMRPPEEAATDDKPAIYETMCFGGPFDRELVHYHDRAKAELGHRLMVERVTEATLPPTPDSEASA